MKIIHTIKELQEFLEDYSSPSLVPTMGHLHEGHLDLVRYAKPLGDITVTSIFVNRLQFLPHEDFDSYPRDLAADCEKLAGIGCDVVFAPGEQELYPTPQTLKVVPSGPLINTLEGQFRPGFFTAVATVVTKLLNITRPKVAVFGQKDYQQLMVIRQLVQQLNLPIAIVAAPTKRTHGGLALSSRNAYLSIDESLKALELSQILIDVREQILHGNTNLALLESEAIQRLTHQGWEVDYIAIRRQSDLMAPSSADDDLVVLAAAKLGKTRLIDSMEV